MGKTENQTSILKMREVSTEKNDPLVTRIELIQKEIDEIRNREREYRSSHASEFGDLVDEQDSLEENGQGLDQHSDEKSSSDGGLSTPSNSTSDLSDPKPLDVTQRQLSMNSINSYGSRQPLGSPVSPSGAFQHRVFVPSQRGLMQKFIISHGKIGSERSTFATNGIHHADYIATPLDFGEPAVRPPIERDEHGRPMRRGYVPVKDKIQQELQDLESREAELKVLRKHLMNEIKNGGEHGHGVNGRVVVQADVKSNCDKKTLLEELQEVPSSHKLIEQWENLIKEKQRQKAL